MSDNIGQALSYIAAANQELRKQHTEEAVIQFCKAYALEPSLVKDHLVTLPQNSLQTVLCTLEDWCICGGGDNSARLLLNSGVTLSLDQICDLITSSGLRPDSRVAWSTKLRLQMRNKSYLEAVTTCFDAVKIFSNHGDVVFFLVQRAMAYLFLNKKSFAVADLIATCDKDFDAGLACIKETGVKILPVILEALYEAIATLAQKGKTLVNQNDRVIVRLNPEDSATLGDCAGHMIKLNQFKEAVVLLSDGIDHVMSSGKTDKAEAVELLLQRAQCYFALKETESALNDYLCAAAIDEDITQITIIALPRQQQGSMVALSKQLSSELLTHYRLKAKLNSSCSVDTKITADNLDRAARMYRFLYLVDSNNVDALVNAAECLKLQDKDAEAIRTLDLVLALRPTCSKAYYTRAYCYMKTADMTNALADFHTTLDIQPSFVQALCGRAFIWLMSGKLEKAAKDLTAASGISIGATVTWITELSDYEQETLKNQMKEYLVTTSKKRQQNADSREDTSLIPLGDVLTRAFSTDFECHLVFVEILQSLCKMDEAQAILVRLITHNPDDYLATLHLAALKMRRNRTAEALEDICALLKTIGEEKLTISMLRLTDGDRARLSREAHCEGVQRFNTRPGDSSIEGYFSVAIAAFPNKAYESYVWRAKLLFLKGEVDLAIKELTSVLAKKPNYVEVLCQRGLFVHPKEKPQSELPRLAAGVTPQYSSVEEFHSFPS
ncbi:Tetratricopeptide repeat protein [Desmophyllum pertusum]|uniref:Tetratricopeptide repeat protein n=1 Tax=Desmophyllum pertusum TaxID=174260 RepID=A0A9W9ZQR9_9CNID|nr:Tetratricopeptide repeat protein [Desmophyllum pertusum]